MGVPIKEFRIKVIKQPNVGEVKPASVTEDVMFTQDVLFLFSTSPSSEPLSVRRKLQN
ncbi:hypothetical protein MKW92_044645 [Papaver armeniacum]|nr:hypothetical protein MKW92_044645 [Papaver armeniacum]